MKKLITVLIITFPLLNVLGQTFDKTYLHKSHYYGSTYSYAISEITIHSDSTFTWKTWNLRSKKEKKSYKEIVPKSFKGKITQNGKFYTITEYRNGKRSDIYWTIKVNNKRLLFLYYQDINEKLPNGARYKRIR